MKHHTSVLPLLVIAAALSGGCRSTHVAHSGADSADVFIRASEIASVDWRRIDPVSKRDGHWFLDVYIDSIDAQSRLHLCEVPLPYAAAVYITDGGELIARGQIESELVSSSQVGIVVRFADRDEAERCAVRLWGEDSEDALFQRSSKILPAAL